MWLTLHRLTPSDRTEFRSPNEKRRRNATAGWRARSHRRSSWWCWVWRSVEGPKNWPKCYRENSCTVPVLKHHSLGHHLGPVRKFIHLLLCLNPFKSMLQICVQTIKFQLTSHSQMCLQITYANISTAPSLSASKFLSHHLKCGSLHLHLETSHEPRCLRELC